MRMIILATAMLATTGATAQVSPYLDCSRLPIECLYSPTHWNNGGVICGSSTWFLQDDGDLHLSLDPTIYISINEAETFPSYILHHGTWQSHYETLDSAKLDGVRWLSDLKEFGR